MSSDFLQARVRRVWGRQYPFHDLKQPENHASIYPVVERAAPSAVHPEGIAYITIRFYVRTSPQPFFVLTYASAPTDRRDIRAKQKLVVAACDAPPYSLDSSIPELGWRRALCDGHLHSGLGQRTGGKRESTSC